MVGKGWVSAAFVLLAAFAPAGAAIPRPDPTLPAPTDVEAAYDETSDMIQLDWSTPAGLDEAAVSYIVYVDGLATTAAEDPHALLPAPGGIAILQVATASGTSQSPLSEPIFYASGDSVLVFSLSKISDDFPPQFCGLFTVQPTSSPPYVFNESCFWGIVDEVINPGEAP